MLNIKNSRFEAELKIKEAIRYLEPDLDVVTKDGAIIRANRLLLSLSSPFLQNLLTGDMISPDRIHLPDVSGPGLIHLINVVKNGFTTGLGPGYSALREIRDVVEKTGQRRCPLCMFSGTRTSLLEHIRVNHTHEKLHSCAFCQQLFTSFMSKRRHEKIHSHRVSPMLMIE